MERRSSSSGSGESRGSRAVRRFLGQVATRLEALYPRGWLSRGRDASWWDDADLEGSAGFSRAAARLKPAGTRQAEFWEETKPVASEPEPAKPKTETPVLELMATLPETPVQETREQQSNAQPSRNNTVAFASSRSYAERSRDEGPAHVAPYLRLSGVLQSGDREDRCFELPRARFRPRLRLGVERRMSIDSIRDAQPPPQRVTAGERFRLTGKVAL